MTPLVIAIIVLTVTIGLMFLAALLAQKAAKPKNIDDDDFIDFHGIKWFEKHKN